MPAPELNKFRTSTLNKTLIVPKYGMNNTFINLALIVNTEKPAKTHYLEYPACINFLTPHSH